MKARGIVFEKRFGACGERLPHPLRVRLVDGPNADPEGAGFCLDGVAPIGATVTVEYFPDDQFARLVPDEMHARPQGRAPSGPAVGAPRKGRAIEADHWTAEDIEGMCPVCDAHAVVELTARLKARQPDGTTHVCLPSFGGCNHGFAADDPRD